MSESQDKAAPAVASSVLFSRRFGRWLGRTMDFLPNNASKYRWWWAWCAIARMKTFAVLLLMGKKWQSSWCNACKMYDINSCRLLWDDNRQGHRVRTSDSVQSHQVSLAQSTEGNRTCIDCSSKGLQSAPRQCAQPDPHQQEPSPMPVFVANQEEGLSLLSQGQEPPSQAERLSENQIPSQVISGWENAWAVTPGANEPKP